MKHSGLVQQVGFLTLFVVVLLDVLGERSPPTPATLASEGYCYTGLLYCLTVGLTPDNSDGSRILVGNG